MDSFDWKAVVQAVAPTLGTALGGPLAGAAVKAISMAVFGNPDAKEATIQDQLASGLSSDVLVKLKEQENSFKVLMRSMDVDVLKLEDSHSKALMEDTEKARSHNAASTAVFRLGMVILATFGSMVAFVLWGSYGLLAGTMTVRDPSMLAVVAGLLGTVIGYVAANAQQVVAFFFGSSKGSADKTDAMADALKTTLTQIGEQQ